MLTADFRDGDVLAWFCTDDGVRVERDTEYVPTVYIDGAESALDALRTQLAADPKIVTTAIEEWRTDLRDREPSSVLRVDLERIDDVQSFAHEMKHHYERGEYQTATFKLYNVDLSPQFRYCVETNTKPQYNCELRTLDLSLATKALADRNLAQLRIDGETVNGGEDTILRVLKSRIDHEDPDVLVLSSADLVPFLYDRADHRGISAFELGRMPGYSTLAGASTFESYGQVGHSPARYNVPGRAIVDKSNSFMLSKAGMPGILDLVDRSWKPLQETAWGSIGTILTAIQIREALDRGILIPWNKWDAEAFKTVETLHAADRGGYTFAPEVGVHEEVVEIDFASLYPNIMCEFNVSPETIGCDCHDSSDVPGLGYSTCDRRGFIPDVLRPIIDDRAAFKRCLKETDDPGEAACLEAKSDALKWILVSCFGYQGYRNAKFGRIECHEAINAYAREIILDAKATLEASGWRVVHGIVDSLWVTPIEDRDQTPIEDVCADISETVNIQLEHENDFDWVAFVPMRNSDAGALTKYFGKVAGEDEYKVRGIELRQRSTPAFIEDAQEAFLDALDPAGDGRAVVDVYQGCVRRLERGQVDPADLVVRNRISKRPEAYTHRTVGAVAAERSEAHGLTIAPGQDVKFVVVDDDATGTDRVRLAFEEPETYDPGYYQDVLRRAAISILSPLGWTETDLRRELIDSDRATLAEYS